MDDVHKKRKDNSRYVYINPNKEDPLIMGPDELKPTSSRKLWKIRHRKPLKKKNKRLEKKGIHMY